MVLKALNPDLLFIAVFSGRATEQTFFECFDLS